MRVKFALIFREAQQDPRSFPEDALHALYGPVGEPHQNRRARRES